jgi:hypothetical protein
MFIAVQKINATDGLQLGDTITINDSTYTAGATENFAANQFQLFTAGTDFQNIQSTSYSLTNCINTSTTNTTIYVAVTANYLIITTDYCMAYFGIRDQAGWELTRNDNPSWVAFGFCGAAQNQNWIPAYSYHYDYYQAWAARITATGTQSSPTKLGNHNQMSGYTTPHAITASYQGNANGSYWGYSGQTAGLRPLFCLAYPTASTTTSYSWTLDPPTTDSVTGLSVPPAYPLVFQYSNGTDAVSGRMPGCYKGMSSTKAGLDYTVTASEYSIGGEAYLPVRTGHPTYPDLFFLRKA